MTRLLPLLALLAGCPSPGLVTGATGIISQAGYTCNTSQLCERADLATAIADRALPLALAALQESGHAPRSTVIARRGPEPIERTRVTNGP